MLLTHESLTWYFIYHLPHKSSKKLIIPRVDAVSLSGLAAKNSRRCRRIKIFTPTDVRDLNAELEANVSGWPHNHPVRLLVSASPNQPTNSIFLSQQTSTSQPKPAQKPTSEQAERWPLCRVPPTRHSANRRPLPSAWPVALGKSVMFAECNGLCTRQSMFPGMFLGRHFAECHGHCTRQSDWKQSFLFVFTFHPNK